MAGVKPGIVDEQCEMLKAQGGSGSFAVAVVNNSLWAKPCSHGQDNTKEADFAHIILILAQLLEAIPVDDCVMIFNTGDQPAISKAMFGGMLPVLEYSGSTSTYTIVMPSCFHIERALGNGRDVPNGSAVPWEDRSPLAWWRGTMSLPDFVPVSSMLQLPRIQLLKVATQHPELFDVALTGLDEAINNPAVVQNALKEAGVNLEDVGPHRRQRLVTEAPMRKILLNVNAVVQSWRLHDLLLTGSALVLQHHSATEWLMRRLTPWEHYVPLREDSSNLLEAVRWLRHNDSAARSLADAAYRVGKAYARDSEVYCFFAHVMRAFAVVPRSWSHGSGGSGQTKEMRRAGYKPARTLLQVIREKDPHFRQRLRQVRHQRPLQSLLNGACERAHETPVS